MTDTIIFDFDGTISVGDGPIRAFAHALAPRLTDAAAERFLAATLADLELAALTGFSDADRDGYGLVRRHAAIAEADASALEAAFHESREQLASSAAPVSAPEGLREFLDALPEGVRAVLVTNAPDTRLAEAIAVLGLEGCFTEVHSSAGKPEQFAELVSPWIAAGRVLSVGDIWGNDLEPVQRLGGDTALIGAATPDTHPSYAAGTLTELLPELTEWASAGTAR